jgi:hypothetical protein
MGDGTVPAVSGRAPHEAGVRQTYRLRGFGHEAAYKDPTAQQAALHSILQIASTVKVIV